jgi:5-methylcytosine-specific restriction endonuclease McrA
MAYYGETKRKYQREWMARRRLAHLHGKFCAQCNSPDNLEIDHIDPALKIDHKIWSWSLKRQEAELLKCQILCRTCHQQKTTSETYKPREHGTSAMYRAGCRCGLCKEDARIRIATWREKRKASSLGK